jgi:hypothetical protein
MIAAGVRQGNATQKITNVALFIGQSFNARPLPAGETHLEQATFLRPFKIFASADSQSPVG